MTALDEQLQSLYDAVSEYLVALSVLQSSSTKVAEVFDSIVKTEDLELSKATKAYLAKVRGSEERRQRV